MKQYQVTSTVRNLEYEGWIYDGVTIYWYYRDREIALVSYEQIIEGYDFYCQLPGVYPEMTVDQMLTYDEAKLLRDYLTNSDSHMEPKIMESDLYIGSKIAHFRHTWCEHGRGIYNLYLEEGYELPFKVAGYFEIGNTKPIEKGRFKGQNKIVQRSDYFERLLDSLDIPEEEKEHGRYLMEKLTNERISKA